MTQQVLFDPDERWPGFLDDLDRDPAQAMTEVWEFLRRLAALAPPRALRVFPVAERDDELQELFAVLTRNEFARLRAYRDQGYPFAVWFYTVADRHLISRLRRRTLRAAESIDGLPESKEPVAVDPATGIGVDRNRIAAKIRTGLAQLDYFCRLLLRARYKDGLTPREIVRLLAWEPNKNVQVAAKIRGCLGVLRTKLAALGVDRDALRLFN